jgi:hypothetical protein
VKQGNGLRSAAQSIQTKITDVFGTEHERVVKMTRASGTANLVVGVGKLVMGIASLSLFTCVSALYTFGMVIAKSFALAGILKAKNKQEQYHYYFMSGIILVLTSLLFIAYSVRLFLHPATNVYSVYAALTIATFTFAELGINIRGIIVERHNHMPLFHAIKMINLASSLICLVLTQTAILSFTDTQIDLHPTANGLIGIVMGAAATIIGIAMIVRIRRIQTGKNYHRVFRKVKKLMKTEGITDKVKPILYSGDHIDEAVLYVSFPNDMPEDRFAQLCANVNSRLQLQLVAIK